jgi:hypothetical protein
MTSVTTLSKDHAPGIELQLAELAGTFIYLSRTVLSSLYQGWSNNDLSLRCCTAPQVASDPADSASDARLAEAPRFVRHEAKLC